MSTGDSATALVVLYALGMIGGYGIGYVKGRINLRNPRHQRVLEILELPPILGMLLFGVLAGFTLPEVVESFDTQWSLYVRVAAQALVVMRCSLSVRWKDVSEAAVSLALCPLTAEVFTLTFLTQWFLGLPWLLALAFGLFLTAVSPGIVTPQCMRMLAYGYGKNKNIQDIVISATTVDTLFSVISKCLHSVWLHSFPILMSTHRPIRVSDSGVSRQWCAYGAGVRSDAAVPGVSPLGGFSVMSVHCQSGSCVSLAYLPSPRTRVSHHPPHHCHQYSLPRRV